MNFWTLFNPIYGAIASLTVGFLIGRMKKVKAENEAINNALGALLRNAMFKIYEKYRDQEEVPVQVQEEMSSLYKPYHELGFNNTGTKIHDEIMAKKTKM